MRRPPGSASRRAASCRDEQPTRHTQVDAVGGTELSVCDLVVLDDDELVRVTLGEALREAGYVVAEAAAPAEALATLRAEPECRLLVTDLHLAGPGGPPSGIRLADQARSLRPGLSVVYITGRPDVLTPIAIGECDRSLSKPFLPGALVDMVNELLVRERR